MEQKRFLAALLAAALIVVAPVEILAQNQPASAKKDPFAGVEFYNLMECPMDVNRVFDPAKSCIVFTSRAWLKSFKMKTSCGPAGPKAVRPGTGLVVNKDTDVLEWVAPCGNDPDEKEPIIPVGVKRCFPVGTPVVASTQEPTEVERQLLDVTLINQPITYNNDNRQYNFEVPSVLKQQEVPTERPEPKVTDSPHIMVKKGFPTSGVVIIAGGGAAAAVLIALLLRGHKGGSPGLDAINCPPGTGLCK